MATKPGMIPADTRWLTVNSDDDVDFHMSKQSAIEWITLRHQNGSTMTYRIYAPESELAHESRTIVLWERSSNGC